MLLPHGARRAVALALLVTVVAPVSTAEASPRRRVIDGIVAVVDDACITRSELARAAAPHEARLARELAGKPVERLTGQERLRKEVLGALIERRLFASEAARRHVEVTDREVDAGLSAVAQQNQLTVPELLAAAKDQGLDASAYRTELRAQILEGKLLQLDVSARYADWSRLSTDEKLARMGQARQALLSELRERSFVEIRL